MSDPQWESPDPAGYRLLDDKAWADLQMSGPGATSFNRCIEVARACGATSAILETRYLDIDYRSEFASFYARIFASIPDSARRLHFFRTPIDPERLWDLPADAGYVGYIVLRPSLVGPVARSVLEVPPGLRSAVRTGVVDRVTLFGREFTVVGAPFSQQDAQLGRCAHAAAWMCHFAAARRGDVQRVPMAQFSLSADPSIGLGRPLPSEGLTVQQLMELFRQFGLPAAFYDVDSLPGEVGSPWPSLTPPSAPARETKFIPIACRYLNSGFPVMVTTEDHAFVLVGYERERRDGKPDWIRFIRNDDQRGPYLLVDDVTADVDPSTGDAYGPWCSLIVPLPERLYLSPEAAEFTAASELRAFAAYASREGYGSSATFLAAVDGGKVALHTYAVTSNRFKSELCERGLDPSLVQEYRLSRLPRYLWIVEAIDRHLRDAGEPPVLGEAIFDGTSSANDPQLLAIHVPGVAAVHRVASDWRYPVACSDGPYESGSEGPP